MPINVSILSLGCARNLVDSEVMLGILKGAGYKIVDGIDGADVAIVNTCSFIEDAKKESIDAILDVIELKEKKKIKHILVTGCLPQRYKGTLQTELKEVDGFIGVNGFGKLPQIIKALVKGERIADIKSVPKYLYDDKTPRIRLTPKHYAYVKISEGCSHKCSFCVIPQLRGPHRSRKTDSVLKEASDLVKSGAKEINLIGQDTTLYGMDLYRRLALAELLKKLVKVKGVNWIRLLYAHPANFTDEIIKIMKDEPAICKYVDLPIQHINDRILKMMRRGASKKAILNLLKKLRKEIPDLVIRTSIIVGFPGETEAEFKELLEFIKDAQFERLGCFAYSREEGSPAYDFSSQISDAEKKSRWDEVMKVQQDVSRENNRKLMGRELDVIIDEKDDSDPNLYLGRSHMDAPEVDGIVYVKGSNIKVGEFVRVKIVDTYEYDLVGEATRKNESTK
ncbi:MAG: 30S ribosomal protein S12 methylthiotransferase RimO [Candidatus Omnitrophota bacterium]